MKRQARTTKLPGFQARAAPLPRESALAPGSLRALARLPDGGPAVEITAHLFAVLAVSSTSKDERRLASILALARSERAALHGVLGALHFAQPTPAPVLQTQLQSA